ncbi:TusE/DsrC/DsvC family sulfur relay protein [uncultured Thiodictyon sp.]|uniref:TusE/DsrC/DsvC family sulfur relay protein n=1 Tax=uncultured Thiodictyon sp. TaxID=1846217 RepID=UPI0025E07B3C|nr:TusE/DsrC/DsvC family sulfur relay protein [uncultured Thiodictyon sp.]
MTAIHSASRDLNLNKKGYLAHFDDWDRGIALALAAADGLTLTDAHWQVIAFMRQYYVANEIPPTPRVVVKAVGPAVSAHVPWTRQQLEDLFPDGGCRQACRIAGLPDYYCAGC